jgi:hypothetical protein
VPEWCARPICVHAWDGNAPEIWDGDDDDGQGRPIEHAPNEDYRTPGPDTWTAMVPASVADDYRKALEQIEGHFLPGYERRTYGSATLTLDLIRAEARAALVGPVCKVCGGKGWHTAGGNDPSACGACPAGEHF